jgi:hypothetical protein
VGGFRCLLRKKLSPGLLLVLLQFVAGRAPEPDIAPGGLVQPCSLERLVDVPAFAAHGLGDLSSAHSFLA